MIEPDDPAVRIRRVRQTSNVSTMLSVRLLILVVLNISIERTIAGDSQSAFLYRDNGLSQTVAYKRLPGQQRRELQDEILSVLGLHHRPHPKLHGTDDSGPRYMMDLYTDLLDEESGQLRVDTDKPVIFEGEELSRGSLIAINSSDKIVSFTNQINRHSHVHRHERDRRFFFDISEVSLEDRVLEGDFRLYRDLSFNIYPLNWTYHLNLYQVVRYKEDEKILKLVDSRTVQGKHGWIRFNATEPLVTWLEFPEQNHGLFLRIRTDHSDRDVEPRDIGITTMKGPKVHHPFLLGFFKLDSEGIESNLVRTRRSPTAGKSKRQKQSYSYEDDYNVWDPYNNPNDRYASGRSCQRRTLYVSFRDLGWQDWIIAPDGYSAFFCDGECSFPLNAHMNATNHAIVQTLVHLMNPYIVPKPCCAPTKLSAIMVLYFDDNSNVILKKYRNMVVKSCGCH